VCGLDRSDRVVGTAQSDLGRGETTAQIERKFGGAA
jgi:hypothetical protein